MFPGDCIPRGETWEYGGYRWPRAGINSRQPSIIKRSHLKLKGGTACLCLLLFLTASTFCLKPLPVSVHLCLSIYFSSMSLCLVSESVCLFLSFVSQNVFIYLYFQSLRIYLFASMSSLSESLFICLYCSSLRIYVFIYISRLSESIYLCVFSLSESIYLPLCIVSESFILYYKYHFFLSGFLLPFSSSFPPPSSASFLLHLTLPSFSPQAPPLINLPTKPRPNEKMFPSLPPFIYIARGLCVRRGL